MQTDEYDLQVMIYPINWKQSTLRCNNGDTITAFNEHIYKVSDRI